MPAAKKAARPSLAPKVTPKSEANRKASMNKGIAITIAGERHIVRVGEITGEAEAELRRVWGGGFMKLGDAIADDPGIDVISVFVWFARLLGGEDIELSDVKLTYADMFADDFDSEVVDGSEVVEVPEA